MLQRVEKVNLEAEELQVSASMSGMGFRREILWVPSALVIGKFDSVHALLRDLHLSIKSSLYINFL